MLPVLPAESLLVSIRNPGKFLLSLLFFFLLFLGQSPLKVLDHSILFLFWPITLTLLIIGEERRTDEEEARDTLCSFCLKQKNNDFTITVKMKKVYFTAGVPNHRAADLYLSVGCYVPGRKERINNYTGCGAALAQPRLDSIQVKASKYTGCGSDRPPTKYASLLFWSDARARCNNLAQCNAWRKGSWVRRETKTSWKL